MYHSQEETSSKSQPGEQYVFGGSSDTEGTCYREALTQQEVASDRKRILRICSSAINTCDEFIAQAPTESGLAYGMGYAAGTLSAIWELLR